MSETPFSPSGFTQGDPVPWFEAKTLAGTRHGLGVMAGRWIALFFAGALDDAQVVRLLADIVAGYGRTFTDDHLVFYGVMTAPTPLAAQFAQASHRGMGFIDDQNGALTAQYHAQGAPQLILIDPMLRVEKIFDLKQDVSAADICACFAGLPKIDDFAGVPIMAPALVIPHVFEPEFCAHLIDLYEKNGGRESGFMRDSGGKTMTVVDHAQKSRKDFVPEDENIRGEIRRRVTRRVVPMMERFLQYRPTRMDRYLVSCYDAESGGHFARHRDNINQGARHRRFAASFNLNDGYEGCGLIFPEFGRRVYVAPKGGAIVFSTGALHQVLPITRGKRYAFVPFFYGEEEAQMRLANNARLHEGEGVYTGENDKLFP